MPSKAYFQGFTQIMSPFYFSFIKDEYILPTNGVFVSMKASIEEEKNNDYPVFCKDIEVFFEDYVGFIHCVINLSEVSLGPVFADDLTKLTTYVNHAFHPFLRYIDSRLYEIIYNN